MVFVTMQCCWPLPLLFVLFMQHVEENEALKKDVVITYPISEFKNAFKVMGTSKHTGNPRNSMPDLETRKTEGLLKITSINENFEKELSRYKRQANANIPQSKHGCPKKRLRVTPVPRTQKRQRCMKRSINTPVFNIVVDNPSYSPHPPTVTESATEPPEPTSAEERNNPCNYEKFEHSVPEPDRVGKRVSEIKCEEYSLNYWVNFIEKERNRMECKKLMGDDATAIIGGDQAKYGDFPHMGAVGWMLPNTGTISFLCGSTLISPKFTLTAAHCRQTSRINPYLVRFGSTYIGSDATEAKKVEKEDILIANFWMLDEFRENPHWKYNDIALIELERELTIQANIRPACLWSGVLGNNWVANITGWGRMAVGGVTSNHLKYAEVDYVDKERCKGLMRLWINRNWKQGLKDHQFCAGKLQGGVDSCEGDSGGPVQIRRPMHRGLSGQVHYVVGVTSFGIKCASRMLPGVYVNVTSFLCKIEKTVWPDENNPYCPSDIKDGFKVGFHVF